MLSVLTPLSLGGNIPAGHGFTCLYPQLLERLTWKDLLSLRSQDLPGHHNGTPSQKRRDIVFDQLYLLFPSVLNSNSLDNYATSMHHRSDRRCDELKEDWGGVGVKV